MAVEMNCASSLVCNSVRLRIGAALVLFALLLLSSALLAAQQLPSSIERPADAAGVYAIWPGAGIPSGSENWTWHEQSAQVTGTKVPNRMVRNVVIPTVTLYKPASGTANGTALIVAPGGAFRFLMFDLEGAGLAHALTPLGVTVFVLRYRVAHTPEGDAEYAAYLNETWKIVPHPDRSEINPPVGNAEAEQARDWADADALQAIRFVRAHADDWGIDSKRIGIAGFSAGGIGVDAAMHHTADSRPDFVAGIYPGYRPESMFRKTRRHFSLRLRMTTSWSPPFPARAFTRLGTRQENPLNFTSFTRGSMALP